MTHIAVLIYMLFHSWLLSRYNHLYLAAHALYIASIILYMNLRMQPLQYNQFQRSVRSCQQTKRQYPQSCKEPSSNIKDCIRCKRPKPERYHHCRVCQQCIYRMDHHCLWVGNCIGHFNIKPYIHLITNVFIHGLAVSVLVVGKNFFQIIANQNGDIYLLVLVVPCLFMIFEGKRLLWDVYQMVDRNQTLIDSYKLTRGRQLSFKDSLNEYLGSKNKQFRLIFFYVPSENPWEYVDLNESMISTQETKADATYADEYIYGVDSDQENQNQTSSTHSKQQFRPINSGNKKIS